MVKVGTFFAMSLGAFIFWETMDKVHVWIALRQDEKKERLEKEAEIRRVRRVVATSQRKGLSCLICSTVGGISVNFLFQLLLFLGLLFP